MVLSPEKENQSLWQEGTHLFIPVKKHLSHVPNF